MKIKSLVLFAILIAFFLSCEKDMKWINQYDPEADLTEISNICEEKSAECGIIEVEFEGKKRSVFCGECEKDGYGCNTDYKCSDIDECADSTLNNCPRNSVCINEDATYSCSCKEHYSGDNCDPDTRTRDCEGLPENAEWNKVSSITQTWDGETWIPSEIGSFDKEASSTKCCFKCLENYSWKNNKCNADTRRVAKCKEKPANTVWNDDGAEGKFEQTWSGSEWLPESHESVFSKKTPQECGFKCATGFYWKEDYCEVAPTQEATCTGLPEYAEWNTVSTITQTWDGDDWEPTSAGSYSETASSTECRFQCIENYNWNSSTKACEGAKKKSDCTGLPENAQWNTASSITQQWNGEEWEPDTTGIYNEKASTTECRYKCKTNYNWNSSTSTCNAATQQANCSSKPANTVWNDNGANGKFTQTWNGSKWDPSSYTSTYNETPGTCRFKCDTNYRWNGSKCINPYVQCSSNSGEPCTDFSSGLMWSKTASSTMNWYDAVSYCNNLKEIGFDDWHLPNIDELRTLIKNRKTVYGGACGVSEENGCLSWSCFDWDYCAEDCNGSFDGCPSYSDGRYSIFGDTSWFWSSSTVSGDSSQAWIVSFWDGCVANPVNAKNNNEVNVRCVRNAD